jgi:hypothetical protein
MQEIIVYRNPGEKAIWDFFLSANGFIFMVCAFVLICSIIFVDSKIPWHIKKKLPYLSLWISLVITTFVAYLMI